NKLAFSTPTERYRFKVMPFGISNSPSHFQRVIFVLNGIRYVLVYIDDVIVYSRSFPEHLDTLRSVFTRLRDYGLFVKGCKCAFGMNEIEVLGFKVGVNGIAPSPANTKAIVDMAVPKTSREVATFLGMIGYFHRFIPKCADLEAPLRIAKKD